MDEQVERLERFEKRASNDLVAIHQRLQILSQDIHDIKQDRDHCIGNEEYEFELTKADLKHENVKLSLRDLNFQISNMLSKQAHYHNELDAIKGRFADFEESILPIIQELQRNTSACLIERDQNHVLIPSLLDNLKRELKESIQAIDIPMLDVDQVKKEMLEIAKPAIDESKAAHNKNITTQSRVTILEKKLENFLKDRG